MVESVLLVRPLRLDLDALLDVFLIAIAAPAARARLLLRHWRIDRGRSILYHGATDLTGG